MTELNFSRRLAAEFERRKARNRRYSVRAFAAMLDADHGTVAQVLRGSRAATGGQIEAWSKRLGFSEVEAMVYLATRSHDSPERAASVASVTQIAAEALCLVTEPMHRLLLAHARSFGTLPDLPGFAAAHGRPVDEAQMALSRLLRLRWIVQEPAGAFRDATGAAGLDPVGFARFVADQHAGALVSERAG